MATTFESSILYRYGGISSRIEVRFTWNLASAPPNSMKEEVRDLDSFSRRIRTSSSTIIFRILIRSCIFQLFGIGKRRSLQIYHERKENETQQPPRKEEESMTNFLSVIMDRLLEEEKPKSY